MDYNTLWSNYQKALKQIETLEKRLEQFKNINIPEGKRYGTGNKQNKPKSRGK